MEEKKSRPWKLFGARKSGCCSVEIEEIPEEERREDACCPCCDPGPKDLKKPGKSGK